MKVKGYKRKDIYDGAVQIRPEDVAGVERRNLANALFHSVVNCNFQRVRFMLDTGVSPKIINDDGQNLLVASLFIQDEAKRDKMFQLLIKRGADPCALDEHAHRDVLGWAAYLGRSDQVSYIVESVMGEIDLQRRDYEGMTPLHHAVIGGHYNVVEILVNKMNMYGLNVDVTDIHGLTPYIYARRLAQTEIANILIDLGKCSKHQLDSKRFKSADEWETIGRKEKLQRERERLQKERCMFRLKKLTPIKSQSMPKFAVSLAPGNMDKTSSRRSDVVRSSTTRNSSASVDISAYEERISRSRAKLKSTSLNEVPSLSLSSPGSHEQLNQSAAHLIQITTPSGRPNSREIEQMLLASTRSNRDKDSGSPISEKLAGILDLVAAKYTPSYREPVRPPTPDMDDVDAGGRKLGMGAMAAAGMLGKRGRADTIGQRKTLAGMSSMLSASTKFTGNLSGKNRKKALGLPTVA